MKEKASPSGASAMTTSVEHVVELRDAKETKEPKYSRLIFWIDLHRGLCWQTHYATYGPYHLEGQQQGD